jgi:hypothetical protein
MFIQKEYGLCGRNKQLRQMAFPSLVLAFDLRDNWAALFRCATGEHAHSPKGIAS